MTDSLQRVVDELLAATGASRCTIRQDLPGDFAFPVTHEALAPGVSSLRDVRTIVQTTQPVIQQMLRDRTQVVQDDSASAFDDPEFHRMREVYGGLAAQIVTPVFAGDALRAVVSLHQLGSPRTWTREEIELCAQAGARVRALIEEER